MKHAIAVTILLTLSVNAFASSAIIRLPDGQLAPPGSNVNKVIQAWGNPLMDIKSERTCKFIQLKKNRYCSRWRLVWKRDDLYWMVQYSGNMIIDTKRTVTSSERIYDQTQRYLDHTDHLIHVTLNQKYKEEEIKNKKLTTLTVFEFIKLSHNYIGTTIPDYWLSIFENYAKDSSKRIKKNQ